MTSPVPLKQFLLASPFHQVRLLTVLRVMIIVLISFLHLVSLLLLSLSLALGSGGLVEAGAISVDWLAMIVMAIFLLHRIKRPQREHIRPRSLICFSALLVINTANFVLLLVRLTTDGQGLVRDFSALKHGRAAAFSIVVIAGVTTLLGLAGLFLSYTGCYVEPRPKLRPFISGPMWDWHPHPVATATPSPMSAVHSEIGPNAAAAAARAQYVPGLVPQWPRTPLVNIVDRVAGDGKAASRRCGTTRF